MNIPNYRRELDENILSDRLVILRINAHYSQEKIAEKLNMDSKAYGKYEQGKNLPSLDTVIALADMFNVSTDYILTGKEHSVFERLSSILSNYDETVQANILNIVESILAISNNLNTPIKR